MKELHIEKFDALLSLAAAECVKDEATAFVSADLSGVEDNPRMLRKILGISGKSKWKALKIIVLVDVPAQITIYLFALRRLQLI